MIEQGQIVEYIDNNQFIVAVCLDFKKEKPRLLTQANREVVLPPRRLIAANGPRLSLDAPREELVLRLKELNEKRENLKTGIDLAELWSLVDEGDDSIYSPGFLAGLTFGDPADADQVSALLRAVIEDKIYFRYRPEGLSFTPPEKVGQLLAQQERQQELAREREEAGGWLARIWSGRPPASSCAGR